jgi:hypothetical protein
MKLEVVVLVSWDAGGQTGGRGEGNTRMLASARIGSRRRGHLFVAATEQTVADASCAPRAQGDSREPASAPKRLNARGSEYYATFRAAGSWQAGSPERGVSRVGFEAEGVLPVAPSACSITSAAMSSPRVCAITSWKYRARSL